MFIDDCDSSSKDLTANLPPEVKLRILSWIPDVIEFKHSLAQEEEDECWADVYLPTNSDTTCRSLSRTNRSWRAAANEYIYESVNLHWDEACSTAAPPLILRLSAIYQRLALPYGRLVKHLILPLFVPDAMEKFIMLARIIDCFTNLKRLHIVMVPLHRTRLRGQDPHRTWSPCVNALHQFQQLEYFGIASAVANPIPLGDILLNGVAESGVFDATEVQMTSIRLQKHPCGPAETAFLPSLSSTRKLSIKVPSGLETATLLLPPNSTSVCLTYRFLDRQYADISLVSLQRIKSLRIRYQSKHSELSFADDIKLSSRNIDWINLVHLTLEGFTTCKLMSSIFRNAPKLRHLSFFAPWSTMLDIRDLTAALEDDKGFSTPVALITIHDRADTTETVLVSRKIYEESGELEFELVCSRRKIVTQRIREAIEVRVGREGERYVSTDPSTRISDWLLASAIECFVNLERIYIEVSGPGPRESVEPTWNLCMIALARHAPLEYVCVYSYPHYDQKYLGDRDLRSLADSGIFNASSVGLKSTMLRRGTFDNTFLPSLTLVRVLSLAVPSGSEPGSLDLPPACTNVSLHYPQEPDPFVANISATSLHRFETLRLIGDCERVMIGFAIYDDPLEWHNLVDLTIDSECIPTFKLMSGIFRYAPNLRRLSIVSQGKTFEVCHLAELLYKGGQFDALDLITIRDDPECNHIAWVDKEEFERCGESDYQSVCCRRKIASRRLLGDTEVEVGKESEGDRHEVICFDDVSDFSEAEWFDES